MLMVGKNLLSIFQELWVLIIIKEWLFLWFWTKQELLITLMILNNLIKKHKRWKIITNTISIFILLLMVNCSEDDFTFGSLQAPTIYK
jgi:hypothetical protein